MARREVFTDEDRVAIWRYDEARRLGYETADCHTIAAQQHVDLHELAALIAAGCPTELALEILL